MADPKTQEIKPSVVTQTAVKSVSVDYYTNPVLHLAIEIWRIYSLEISLPLWKFWIIVE